ncbi:hypothetical protein MJL79_28545, partial [Salmonella enterica subsp. enterica serovar Montevideo]|nr:hypothetical protein [Salmonella enterica subsp. enterica serovar Montevideo]
QNDAEKVLPQPINKNTSTGKSNSSKNEENKLDAESVKEPLKVIRRRCGSVLTNNPLIDTIV